MKWVGNWAAEKPLRWALMLSLGLRIGISATLALFWAAIRPYIASTLAKLGTDPLFPIAYNNWGNAFLGIWNRYDGYRYFLLAYSGYTEPSNVANTVFYPAFPMLLRFFWKLSGIDLIAISLIISTVASFFMFYLLYKLCQDEYGDQPAKYSVLSMALYPTAMFFVGPYTESMFLALTLAAFYYARKNRWLLVGLMGALASLTRAPGVFTSFALAWIAWRKWRESQYAWTPQLMRMAFGVAAPGIAGIGFLMWRKWMGFLPILTIQQEYFQSYVVNPIAGVIAGLKAMVTQPTVTNVIEGLTIVIWIALFTLMVTRRKRVPTEWLIYYGLNLLIFCTKANSLISPMQSVGRYVLVLFPGFIFIGSWLAKSSARERFAYLVASALLLIVNCALYTIGFFVG